MELHIKSDTKHAIHLYQVLTITPNTQGKKATRDPKFCGMMYGAADDVTQYLKQRLELSHGKDFETFNTTGTIEYVPS